MLSVIASDVPRNYHMGSESPQTLRDRATALHQLREGLASPAYAQIRTACKKTETEATGTQQTALDKANAALVDELGQARRCDQIAHDRDSYPGEVHGLRIVARDRIPAC
jgi:hypothetical protein